MSSLSDVLPMLKGSGDISLNDVRDQIETDEPESGIQIAFRGEFSAVVADRMMTNRHAAYAMVIDGEKDRWYADATRLYEAIARHRQELRQLMSLHIGKRFLPEHTRPFSRFLSAAGLEAFVMEGVTLAWFDLAWNGMVDYRCQQYTCYRCEGIPQHTYPDEPGEKYCRHVRDHNGDTRVPLKALDTTAPCCD